MANPKAMVRRATWRSFASTAADATDGYGPPRADQGGNQTKMSKFLVTGCGREREGQGRTHRDDAGGHPRQHRSSSDTCTRTAPRSTRRTTFGWTALMYAAHFGKTATAKFLIEELKADKTLKHKYGRTAADVAMANNHPITFAAIDPAAAAKRERSLRRRWRRRRSWT